MKRNRLKKLVAVTIVALTLGGIAPTIANADTIDNSSTQVQTYVINQDNKAESQSTNFDPSVSFSARPGNLKIDRWIRKFLKKHFGIR